MKKKTLGIRITLIAIIIFLVNAFTVNAYQLDLGGEETIIRDGDVFNSAKADEQQQKELEIYQATGVKPENYGAREDVLSDLNIPPRITYDEKTLPATVPVSYDSRNYGKVTSVKNQGSYGTCWAHAAMNAEESAIINNRVTTTNLDFSELQFAYFCYHRVADPLNLITNDKVNNISSYSWLDVGHNTSFSSWTAASWTGPIHEYLAPYSSADSNMTLDSSLSYWNDAGHVQNIYRINSADTNAIKTLIMEYGSGVIQYYSYSLFYNTNYAYYNDYFTSINHIVSVVGWDDDYSKYNFKKGYVSGDYPPENGAWLIKNSWGSGWGNSGYFWLSYYDTSIDNTFFFFDTESSNNYDRNYQYDGSAGSAYMTKVDKMANVFTSQKNERIEAVSFASNETNIGYTIKIYTNVIGTTNPEYGTLSAVITGTETYAGYHTVKLTNPIAITSGTKFSVVVDLAANENSYFIDYSYTNGNWIQFVNNSSAGQSFYYNSKWYDMASTSLGCARIKAFTNYKQNIASDFDGNGTTDVALFRPWHGEWFVKDQLYEVFGLSGDIPVPGDYNGDGKTDVAVFRPWSGEWFVKNQFNGVFGLSGDIPVPGDYNGDGKTDIAVYRPWEGVWYVRNQFNVGWGTSGEIPVPGDYNGDGKTDIAVYRPSNGVWYVRNQFNVGWGTSEEIPVSGDYNGDGKTDIAVYRPSNGTWYVRNQFNVGWGTSEEIPVPGDYNGDGKTDVAVYRPSNGTWYVKDQYNVQFGLSGDIPIPSRK
ncbi:lectin like domain-containing protein [Flexilinea flocculi]|uniref:Cysteine protease, C1A family n=1 Tax=Flexilinea flocculi TaxID=1678840 RepID=A0A0K8P8X3_9CHLR|nr:lectin like domain-containing protein [Flexilinea flocculi]GAP39086.1 cysteine protease, C1A family [Flexilinea flocculi]